MLPKTLFTALFLLPVVGCDRVEQLSEGRQGATPHERYADGLRSAGLNETALARDWLDAASSSLRSAHEIAAPFAESGYLAPERPTALTWSLEVRRGQRVRVETELSGGGEALLFLDVFELPDDTTREPRRAASADSAARTLEFEPRRSGRYIVRVQPELLRGGRYTVTILAGASLAFPVAEHGIRSVGSRFGAPRDGGARAHHGVDIFAPRGTPVLAAAEAVVSRVNETPRGGRVVWLRDARRAQSIYYAHLDVQLVESGRRVRPGDTLGLVGNTGNAARTAPHLHFGIYASGEGAIDPYPFLYSPPSQPPPLTADTAAFDRWMRVRDDALDLRNGPAAALPALARMERHTALRVEGATGGWYRVRLPTGAAGYVPAQSMARLDEPLEARHLEAATSVHASPDLNSAVTDRLAPGSALPVLARYGAFLLVPSDAAGFGWTPAHVEPR